MNFTLKEFEEPVRYIFDLETLDTRATAVVLSLGIVPFTLTGDNTFEELVAGGTNILFNIEEQSERGRTCSADTIAWWGNQGESAQEVLSGGTRHSPASLHELIAFTVGTPAPKAKWYARGLHFDMAIMNSLCDVYGIREPWGYQGGRDLRTWFDFYAVYEREAWRAAQPGFIAHNSLHDSALEALHMQYCYQQTLLEEFQCQTS